MSARELGLMLTEERVVVSSLDVARNFEKEHKDVLKAVKNLDCSEEFRQRNFALSSETVGMPNGGTREQPTYLITRDGFAFLAMGFTGKKAAQFKEAYIMAFNEMERKINVLPPSAEKVFRWRDSNEAISMGHYVRPLVIEFVMNCCEPIPQYLTSRQDFYFSVLQYCVMSELLPPTRCATTRAMNDMSYYKEYRSCGERYWKGLRILPPQMWKR